MPHEWVSVREAARRLGISPETVRRRIEAGELVGEREALGGSRERFRVRMETPQGASGERPDMPMTPSTLDATETPTNASALTGRALEIMEALLRANAETFERQAETIADLRERAGRAEASLEAANAELTRLRKPWWRKLWPD